MSPIGKNNYDKMKNYVKDLTSKEISYKCHPK
jgi:hypothetical protein